MCAGMLHRLGHRLLGDGVEDDPLDLLILDGVLLLERFQHVPGNRLALAVGVGGEDELVGALHGARDIVESLLRLGIDFPEHVKIGLGIDRSVLGRKVAHMAERSENLVAAAEIRIDRLGLGGGFDNDYVHVIPRLFVIFAQISGTGRQASPQGKWVNAPRLSNRKTRMAPRRAIIPRLVLNLKTM